MKEVKKKHPELKKIPCSCGCGEFIYNFQIEKDRIRWDRPNEFLVGHHNRLPESRKRLSSTLKGRSYDEIHGVEEAKRLKNLRRENSRLNQTGKKRDIESRKKQGVTMRKKWQETEYSNKVLKSQRHICNKPTDYEKRISDLCIANNLPFFYSGNGTFLIGNKIPDFINEEKRIAIEVFNNYHKKLSFGSVESYIKKRTEYFEKYGYKIIFIGEEIMEDLGWKEICLNKIRGFL